MSSASEDEWEEQLGTLLSAMPTLGLWFDAKAGIVPLCLYVSIKIQLERRRSRWPITSGTSQDY